MFKNNYKDMGRKEKIKLSNGETIFYEHIENGHPPLLMLHGNICSGSHFKPFIPYISQRYDLYIPDMRGFGESSYLSPISSINDLSSDIYDFTSKLHLDEFDLLGWSAGGCVCMQFAADYFWKVKKLFLVESVGYKGCPMYDLSGNTYADLDAIRKEPNQVLPAQTAIEKQDADFMRQLWNNAIFTNKKPSHDDMIVFTMASLKQRNLPEIYWTLANFNMSNENNGYAIGTGEIMNIKSPVLLIWGKDDKIITEKEIRETANAINSKTEVIVFENCGHSPFIDYPEQLLNQIINFAV